MSDVSHIMPIHISRFIPELVVIACTTLLGLSIAKVTSPESPDYIVPGVGGMLIGVFAAVLISLSRLGTKRVEDSIPAE